MVASKPLPLITQRVLPSGPQRGLLRPRRWTGVLGLFLVLLGSLSWRGFSPGGFCHPAKNLQRADTLRRRADGSGGSSDSSSSGAVVPASNSGGLLGSLLGSLPNPVKMLSNAMRDNLLNVVSERRFKEAVDKALPFLEKELGEDAMPEPYTETFYDLQEDDNGNPKADVRVTLPVTAGGRTYSAKIVGYVGPSTLLQLKELWIDGKEIALSNKLLGDQSPRGSLPPGNDAADGAAFTVGE
eukprot:TRINITY_DN5838_c4_g1_i1.p1 TRINITY_DN5838_c4_g1~~TRINITY_DN5838_c4_g1_i1.p1  ORF type:complete len:250 (-),score=38.99 TRINITY_DN5838_c4_g1_i1:114-836(-)